MKIAVVGPQNVGKTTFIKDFVERFPEYKTHTVSYKDVVSEKGLKINQETSQETQLAIMEFIYKLISENEEQNMIFDRCLVDNYVYSYCAYLKGKISSDFIQASKVKMFEHLKNLDVIFFIPTSLLIELEEREQRDVDKKFLDLVNRVFTEILLEIYKNSPIKIYVLSGTRVERIRQTEGYSL